MTSLGDWAEAHALQGVHAALKRRSFTWVGHVGLRVALSHVSEVRERGAPSGEWGVWDTLPRRLNLALL